MSHEIVTWPQFTTFAEPPATLLSIIINIIRIIPTPQYFMQQKIEELIYYFYPFIWWNVFRANYYYKP
jgi:hypothetical protein